MSKLITVEVKQSYGNEHVYITSEQSEAVQKLTGRKTVTQADVTALKQLGFSFEVKQSAINF